MKYPKKLNLGDTIGVTAPSCGISKEEKLIKLDNAKVNIENLGYKYIETESVRKDEFGRSADGKTRAKEFMYLWEKSDVKAILAATGGDFLVEMLEYLDFEKIKNSTPKWFKGYSDITGLSFLLTTICDIATIYGENAGSYGMKKLYKDLLDSFKIMAKEEIEQHSFEKYERNWMEELKNGAEIIEEDPLAGYDLVNDVKWKNLRDKKEIHFKGRSLGGCFDVITNLIGTKYDNVSNYIEKYKDDGIIWFLEIFEMSTPGLFLNLWKMKNAGFFKNCKGIIFGRSLSLREDYGIDFKKAVLDAIGDLKIPIIYDADIGHLAPTINMVNGAILDIESKDGKGVVKTYFG